MQNLPAGVPINLTASGIVSKVPGVLLGFYVNSTSSGTIVVRNGSASGSTAVSGTITPAVGWHNFPAALNGCYLTIGSTLDVTAFFAAG